MTANIILPHSGASRAGVEQLSRSRREPDWLLELRLRALDAFERLPMPDQRTESWRRTSLRGLDLAAVDPVSADPTVTLRGAVRFEDALSDPRLEPIIRQHFSRVVALDVDKFVALHYALFNAAALVYVSRGTILEEPVEVRYGGTGALLPHTLVVLEDQSDIPAVVEDLSGGASFASGVLEQVVGANAHTRHVQVQRFGRETWNFSTQRTYLAQDASVRTLNVALGSRTSRNTVQVILNGKGSQADLLGVVDVAGRQHVDFETLQEHSGDATRSDLVIHNALRERSSTNFTGLIRINKSAHQTESSQEQKNILLSDSAKADSDPKLEILNNDVIRCTHGAAVGPVDEEMVFYLQSRGLERLTAEQLIVEGFFKSTISKLQRPAVEETVWAAVTDEWARR